MLECTNEHELWTTVRAFDIRAFTKAKLRHMKHTFERKVRLPFPAREVFDWHARPGALERLCPPSIQPLFARKWNLAMLGVPLIGIAALVVAATAVELTLMRWQVMGARRGAHPTSPSARDRSLGIRSLVVYAAPLAIFVGITDLIPNIGATLGTIPVVIVGLLEEPWKGVVAGAVLILYQQVENNLITPKVFKKTVGISSNSEHPLLHRTTFYRMASPLTFPINNFFVGKHRP